jgi:putative transposase
LKIVVDYILIFRRIDENKNGKKQKVGSPRFKGYFRYGSFSYPHSGFEIKDNRLNLSRIGSLKIKSPERLKPLTIKRTEPTNGMPAFQ